MYKDKDKQRQAVKDATRRYRANMQGITQKVSQVSQSEGITEQTDKVSQAKLVIPRAEPKTRSYPGGCCRFCGRIDLPAIATACRACLKAEGLI